MKNKLILALVLALLSACSMTARAGFTPRYEVDMPEIPEVKAELSDEVKEAVNNAAQKQIEKMILDKPAIINATCWHCRYFYPYKNKLIISWESVEGATSYKVEITDASGTRTKEVTTNYLILSEGSDFYPSCMDTEDVHPTVRVRAYGEDETYSMRSDVTEIRCYE
ncbi:hypothetical protein ACTNEF_06755 [Bariatricus sp. HCP28S3_E4]|uniref:hypothetical protein n=1 Tax=unclassified Bariatricus TaxID=2677046 RepID=UPI003F8A2CD4